MCSYERYSTMLYEAPLFDYHYAVYVKMIQPESRSPLAGRFPEPLPARQRKPVVTGKTLKSNKSPRSSTAFLSSFSTLKEGFDTLDAVFAIDRLANHSPARRQDAVALHFTDLS
jgi:hypothetical protein